MSGSAAADAYLTCACGWRGAGLMNGLLLRTEVDKVTGQLSDTRTRFLGTRPPKLFAVAVRGRRSMLALSSRPWLVRACARVSPSVPALLRVCWLAVPAALAGARMRARGSPPPCLPLLPSLISRLAVSVNN